MPQKFFDLVKSSNFCAPLKPGFVRFTTEHGESGESKAVTSLRERTLRLSQSTPRSNVWACARNCRNIEQRLSLASIKFLWLRQIHDPSGISPALDNALSTLLSCCSQHFFPVRVLASFIHFLPVVTLSDNDSKQIAAATSFRMSPLLTVRTFLVKVKKN